MPLLVELSSPSPSMELWLSSKRWFPIKAGEERTQKKKQKGIHTVKEADMLAKKIDLVMKRLDERAHEKETMRGTVQAIDLHMTCKVYGNVRHSGNDCPETREDAAYIKNGFRQ
jgi:hypothetical protein